MRVFRLRSKARMRPYPRRLSTLPSLACAFGPPVHARSPSRSHARNLGPEDDGLPVPRHGADGVQRHVDQERSYPLATSRSSRPRPGHPRRPYRRMLGWRPIRGVPHTGDGCCVPPSIDAIRTYTSDERQVLRSPSSRSARFIPVRVRQARVG